MTITWKIDEMQRQTADGLVIRAFWRAEGIDGDFRALHYGVADFVRGDTFIPFEDLTEEVVVEWVKNSVDVAAVEQDINQNIEKQKNPPFLSGLPW